MMGNATKPDSPISETARRTSTALLAIWDLDDNEDPQWYDLVQVCRCALTELAQSPSHTSDDALEKAFVLALMTTCDYMPDHRAGVAIARAPSVLAAAASSRRAWRSRTVPSKK